jgi:hypothetical protein
MEEITKLINDTDWAVRSKRNRINFIKDLKEKLSPKSKGLEFLKNFQLVSDYLLDRYTNVNTRKNKILDINSILKLLNDTKTIKKYQMLTDTLINESEIHRGENIEKEERKISHELVLDIPETVADNIKYIYEKVFLSKAQIDELRTNSAKFKYLKMLTEYVVMCLYCLQPPVRTDWCTVLLDHPQDKENWLDSRKLLMTIHWNAFKNVKSFGRHSFELSSELSNILHNYIYTR